MAEMRQRLITGALLVTAGGFAAGAWAALATNALALATNTIQEDDR